jgi:hypothetical protein
MTISVSKKCKFRIITPSGKKQFLLLSSEYNKEDIRTTTNQSSCKIDALNLSSFLFDDIGPITSWSFPFPIWIKSLGVLKIQEKLN